MEYGVVVETVIVLFLLLSVGYVCGRLHVFSEQASKDMTRLLMDVALPCIVFFSLVREYDAALLKSGLIAIGCTILFVLVSGGLGFLLWRVFRVPRARRGIWIFLSTFPNTAFLGYPIAYTLFGSDGLFLAVMINLTCQLMAFSLGLKTISLDGEEHSKMSWGIVLKNNANYAIVLGFFFFFTQIKLPTPVLSAVEYLSDLTLPLSLFVVGLSLCKSRFRDVLKNKEAFTASFMRLLVGPGIAYLLTLVLPLPAGSLVPAVLILLTAMPSATLALIFSEQQGGMNSETASSGIFVSSLFCLLTIPLVMLLV